MSSCHVVCVLLKCVGILMKFVNLRIVDIFQLANVHRYPTLLNILDNGW